MPLVPWFVGLLIQDNYFGKLQYKIDIAGVLVVGAVLSILSLTVQGFYDQTDEVYDLTPDSFQKMVIDSHFVWIVEFYAPW